MNRTQVLPTVLICINIANVVVYFFAGDIRRAIYWAAAAVLTASVTF